MSAIDRPRVVCLCGSTRFWREFQRAGLERTLAGEIVLSIGAASGTDDEHFGNLPPAEYARVKAMLDTLHLRKIDRCDYCLILNIGGYVGHSTAREVAYAYAHDKPVRWRECLPGSEIPRVTRESAERLIAAGAPEPKECRDG